MPMAGGVLQRPLKHAAHWSAPETGLLWQPCFATRHRPQQHQPDKASCLLPGEKSAGKEAMRVPAARTARGSTSTTSAAVSGHFRFMPNQREYLYPLVAETPDSSLCRCEFLLPPLHQTPPLQRTRDATVPVATLLQCARLLNMHMLPSQRVTVRLPRQPPRGPRSQPGQRQPPPTSRSPLPAGWFKVLEPGVLATAPQTSTLLASW